MTADYYDDKKNLELFNPSFNFFDCSNQTGRPTTSVTNKIF